VAEDAISRMTTLRALLQEVQQAADSGESVNFADAELGAEQERWLQPRSSALRALARLLFALNRLVMRGVFRVRAEGLQHLPDDGPFLIAPNHASFLDPFAIAAVLSWRQLQRVYWAGWTGFLFRGPVTKTFSRATQTVPVDPEHGLTSTLVFARAILDRGKALTWFPEGERSQDGKIHRFLPGAGLLIQKTKVPAVPVLISGAYEAWPRGQRMPRVHAISLRFGAPLMLADAEPDASADGAERIASRLRDSVLALANGHSSSAPAERQIDGR
jgi:long-chain acyl-CoA synthetase